MADAAPFRRHLILFGRYPVPGRTKTRLIPVLGPLGAADLQRRLTEKSVATVLSIGAPDVGVEFCHSGGTRRKIQRWLGGRQLMIHRQSGADLGARMRSAIFDGIDRGSHRVVLVGTDIPAMTSRHLKEAFDALDSHDLVLGPSRDGGYWLVGMKRKTDIFHHVRWGSERVLGQTMAAARKLGLSVHLLPTLNDMDTEADLKDGLPTDAWRNPYLSVIVPCLDEEASIERSLQRVTSSDTEIIVVDGGSGDRTVEIAKANGARVISAHRGRAMQQNTGARRAGGRVLLFLHADTLLPSDFGDQIFDTLMDRSVVAGAFQFQTDYRRWSMRFIEQIARLRSTLFQMPYGDQALFMPRAVFEQAGGFPLTPIAEDLYLVRRLRRLGRIALAPGAAVTSGRRWRDVGVWRATLVNYLIAGGCLAGVAPQRLAPLYRLWVTPCRDVKKS